MQLFGRSLEFRDVFQHERVRDDFFFSAKVGKGAFFGKCGLIYLLNAVRSVSLHKGHVAVLCNAPLAF